MLGFMRKNARSTTIKIMFWMIIVVFCFWGVGVMMGGERVNVAATVDGEAITAQAYAVAYERLQRSYREVYRENFTSQVAAQLNLEQRALDDLVTSILLRREARQLGLRVSDDEVRDAILSIPTFHDGGRFDRGRYLATLRASRVTPTEFEESQREALLIGKLESLLTDGLYVSDREVHDLFVFEAEKVDVAFAKVPYERFRDAVEVTDAAVAAYYEEHRERFRVPDQVTIAYVAYEPKTFEARVPVSDEAIQVYYDTHQIDFETPEQISLRHILIDLPAGADDAARAAARSEAETVLAEARQEGADFAALAREHSDDALTAEGGGDLGVVERGKLEAPLDNAAFALEPGNVSEIVESPQGLHILKLEERKPTSTRLLDEVRDEITRTLQAAGADDAARDALAEDAVKARAGEALETLARGRELTVTTTTPPAVAGQRLPNVQGTELVAAALALEQDAVGEVEGATPPYYLFKVVTKTPSTIEPLDAVRERIAELIRHEESQEKARAAAETLLAEAQAGGAEALTAAAKAAGYEVGETGPIGRTDGLTMLDRAPIIDDLFQLTTAAPAAGHPYLLPQAAAAIVLKERIAPDDTELTDERRQSLRSTALARRRTQTLEAYRDLLRQRADVSVNPNVITGAV